MSTIAIAILEVRKLKHSKLLAQVHAISQMRVETDLGFEPRELKIRTCANSINQYQANTYLYNRNKVALSPFPTEASFQEFLPTEKGGEH